MKYRVEITVEGRSAGALQRFCDSSGYDCTMYRYKKRLIPVMHFILDTDAGLEAVKERVYQIERTIDSLRHRILTYALQPVELEKPIPPSSPLPLYYEYRGWINYEPTFVRPGLRVYSATQGIALNWMIARSDAYEPNYLKKTYGYDADKEYAVLVDTDREKKW